MVARLTGIVTTNTAPFGVLSMMRTVPSWPSIRRRTDRQPETRAARFAGGARVDLIEGVEHSAALELGDADASIRDANFDRGAPGAQDRHATRVLWMRRFDGRDPARRA